MHSPNTGTTPHSGVRVRFAPSPTGYLHMGGARTALFNWLYARKMGGTLILRIEDTDFERSTTEMVEGILAGLKWLGITWDEGPFFQSERLPLYTATAVKLLESGHAYHCFCTKEELESKRAVASAEGRQSKYDGACRGISREESNRRMDNGEKAAVRFRVPETGSTVIADAVCGNVEFQHVELEDFVLLRSDGIPTYHLSVVTDDIDMRVTHILRGADHLSNTPKQILQYVALGAPLPVFAHVPLILGPDKTRLSKRHGATSVMAYRDEGIVPEAFRNFLALLGWTPQPVDGVAREVMSDAELFAAFDFNGVSRSNAVFDRPKLDWFNSEYIRAYPSERLLPLVREEWEKVGLVPDASRDEAWIRRAIDLLKPRARNLKDFGTAFRAYFTDDFTLDPVAVEKFLKDDSIRTMLRELGSRYSAQADFTDAGTEKVLRDFAAEKNIKAGGLINGSRVALTGQAVAPSLFAVMELLGKDKVCKRLAAV